MPQDQTNKSISTHKSLDDPEIDLVEVAKVIWAGKWIIVIATLVALLGSLAIALYLPNKYKSSAILIPASASPGSSLVNIAGKMGGLASLAGLNLGQEAIDKSGIALEVILTWKFLSDFIESENISVQVYASNGWDKNGGELKIDASLYDQQENAWTPQVNNGLGPSSWQLYKKFRKMISVDRNTSSGTITLAVEHYSPVMAKEWVDRLTFRINQHFREMDQTEAKDSIKYLENQIEKTTVSEMQMVFYSLIEEKTKTLMLTEVGNEYILKTVSPAMIAEEKSGPQRIRIAILSAIICGLMTACVILIAGYVGNKF